MPLKHFAIFTMSLILSSPAWAEPCVRHQSTEAQAANLKEVVDKVESSPYLACQDPKSIRNRPPINFLLRDVVPEDGQGNTTREFFSKVIQKIRAQIQESRNQIKNVKACLFSEMKKNPSCAPLQTWATQTLPRFVKESRYDLSLAQSEYELRTWLGNASTSPNSGLKPLGSYKAADWAPLTPAEEKAAKKTLDEYEIEIHRETQNRIRKKELSPADAKKFENESLLAVRYQHFKRYHDNLAKYPILQHLKGPEVGLQDIKTAFAEMETKLNEENKWIDKWAQMLSQKPIPSDVLNLLNYNSLVEESLLENRKFCGLATSLAFTRSDLEIAKSLAIALPTMLVSFFVPPAAGIAVGLGAGALFAGESYKEFASSKTKAMSSIYQRDQEDLAHLESSSDQLKSDIITLPVGFGFGGLLLKGTIKVGTKSWQFANKIMKLSKDP